MLTLKQLMEMMEEVNDLRLTLQNFASYEEIDPDFEVFLYDGSKSTIPKVRERLAYLESRVVSSDGQSTSIERIKKTQERIRQQEED